MRVNQTIIGREKRRELCVNLGASHKANDLLADVVIIILRPPRKDASEAPKQAISVPFDLDQGAFLLQLRILVFAPWVPFKAAPPLSFGRGAAARVILLLLLLLLLTLMLLPDWSCRRCMVAAEMMIKSIQKRCPPSA